MNGQSGLHHVTSDDKKKKRQRLKKLQADIKQQVEFYFSDSNLRKDRFLKQEIDKSEDGYVNIATIANFNRMRNLTTDESLIARALRDSDLLKVSEDKTKLRRKTPVEEPKYNIDDVTVFVENLPHNVDHDMLQKAFSPCGIIDYISLPRYKKTGDPKKFAFIEFATPEGAVKACKLLNNPPRDKPKPDGHFPTTRKGRLILPQQAEASELQLKSMKLEKYGKQKVSKRKREASGMEETSPEAKKEQIPKKKEASSSNRKRNISEETKEETENRGQLEKKAKTKAEASQGEVSKKHDQQPCIKTNQRKEQKMDSRKRKHSGGDDTLEKSSHGSKNHEARSHKDDKSDMGAKVERSARDTTKKVAGSETHKRKREDSESSGEASKAKRSSSGSHRDKDGVEDGRDAKRRRAESEMEEEDGDKKRKRRSRSRRNKKEEGKTAPLMQLRVIPKKEWLELKAEYLTLQKASRQQMKQALQVEWAKRKARLESQSPDKKVAEVKSAEPEFHPGVVVKIKSDKPFASRKEIREQLEGISPVAYIELNAGDTGGFIRLQSAEGAQAVLGKAGSLSNDGGSVELNLLTGKDEQKYWEKLRADRVAKLSSSKKRKNKKRGIERIKEKSERVLGTDKSKGDRIVFEGDD
ncbi:la-related protein 7-like [Acanthaster planci]|uniref:La-related protein 7 n=1 Tax=Acanthaster planci TaxID=133434 RepID=A0A8B7YGD8_ACAPL|nr:la-related protein 7-like [Acanthaster planci]XP_022091460.1 la-related protein 7-like [Acanthaster planci]